MTVEVTQRLSGYQERGVERKKERKKRTVVEVLSTRTCLGKLKDVCRCAKEKAEVKPCAARRGFVASDPTVSRVDKDK